MTHSHRLLLALALILGMLVPAQASVTVTRMEGFNKTWQFVNTDPVYKTVSYPSGYYMDYNLDGLPDYLVCLTDSKGSGLRMFTLNSAPSAANKTYAKDKTAGRDFPAANVGSAEQTVFTPRSPKMEMPDLVVVSRNRSNASGTECTKMTFQRLKKTSKTWPTEATWTITLPFSAGWTIEWEPVSFDSDDYPDFYIYNPDTTAANRRFVLGFYSGQNGKLIWQKTLARAPQDSVPGLEASSHLFVNVLSSLPAKQFGNSDLDNDGKPEILLWYTFTKMDVTGSATRCVTCINLLNASGTPISPKGSAWTTLSTPDDTEPLRFQAKSDLDYDGYRDLILISPNISSPGLSPCFQSFSLKKWKTLFKSTAADFGSRAADLVNYDGVQEVLNFKTYAPADITGDRWPDLTLYRSPGVTIDSAYNTVNYPLSVGLFNACGTQPGRKVWMKTFPGFDQVHVAANDFNYDGFVDFVLTKNPTDPSRPTWTLANTAVAKNGMTLGKQLTYTSSATGVPNPLTQMFMANSQTIENFGDMDGNGQRDTWASLGWFQISTSNGAVDRAGGSLMVYNTPPPSSAAAASRVAALDILVTGENWIPSLLMTPAKSLNQYSFVDNDRDGVRDDVDILSMGAIFALNFQKRGIYPAAGQAQTPTPVSGGQVQVNRPLLWEPTDGVQSCSAYDVYLGTSLSAVNGATHASPEYRGNQGAPIYLPRPALTPNSTYYWRIDTISTRGQVTKGKIWIVKATR